MVPHGSSLIRDCRLTATSHQRRLDQGEATKKVGGSLGNRQFQAAVQSRHDNERFRGFKVSRFGGFEVWRFRGSRLSRFRAEDSESGYPLSRHRRRSQGARRAPRKVTEREIKLKGPMSRTVKSER